MINTAIAKLAAGQNLAGTETREAFDQIMSGGATNAQIAAFITAMRMKGETIDEYKKRDKEESIQYKLPFGGGSGARCYNKSYSIFSGTSK